MTLLFQKCRLGDDSPRKGNAIHGPVAHLGEHPPCKRKVVGSTPIRSTIRRIRKIKNVERQATEPVEVATNRQVRGRR